jgi:hypothetical protein
MAFQKGTDLHHVVSVINTLICIMKTSFQRNMITGFGYRLLKLFNVA